MEMFETDFDSSNYFDEITLAISENGEEAIRISEDYSICEIDLNCENLSSSELIANLGEVFEKNLMNEHLATIELLGNLGYTDMLMYYCAVMDCVFINSELDKNEQPIEIIPPDQYVKETETAKDKVFDLEIEVSKPQLTRLLRILNYLKNKEFKILSNTFYMDGSDFIIFLNLKSVVGYNLRIKIVFSCATTDEAIILQNNVQVFDYLKLIFPVLVILTVYSYF